MKPLSTQQWVAIALLAILWAVKHGGVPIVPSQPDTILLVYESSDTPVKSSWIGANNTLRDRGMQVRVVDVDVVDGTGERPDELKAGLEAAEKAGLPAYVVLSKGKVLKVIGVPDGASPEAIVETIL